MIEWYNINCEGADGDILGEKSNTKAKGNIGRK